MASVQSQSQSLKSDPGSSGPDMIREKNAGLIMATNNSSIVSKRSVERLYHLKPHFFQYFVRKPQRRSPTINRGYWLRMRAIDSVVREFLQRPSTKEKVLINLGCGYDPLPFQWLAREPDLCQNVRFVDVDYKELMITKTSMVTDTPALKDLVMPKEGANSHFVLESERYYGVGCDLRDLERVDAAIRSLKHLDEALILCIAEVSVTYMDPGAADALIAWARTLSVDVTFGLLEQTLPDGPDHPFAKTMLRHFQKLHTPLRSIHRYPDLHSQNQRFYRSGWGAVKSANLWDLWSDPHFLSPSQRVWLDQVEPFDEWEEFALFAAHYFLLTARTKPELHQIPVAAGEEAKSTTSTGTTSPLDGAEHSHGLLYMENSKRQGLRRHGAFSGLPDQRGHVLAAVAHHGGTTYEGRSASSDVYRLANFRVERGSIPPLSISARQCHTITRLKNGYSVLVGGRRSPSTALQDCYLQTPSGWRSIQDLPSPRFRHSAAAVQLSNNVPGLVVVGGKSETAHVQHEIILWREATGWETLQILRHSGPPRFGATLASLGDDFGILSGGMRSDGVILQDLWVWKLVFDGEDAIGITFTPCSPNIDPGARPYLGRFGATSGMAKEQLLLIGGIGHSGCIQDAYEILSLSTSDLSDPNGKAELNFQVSRIHVQRAPDVPRPMLVGHATLTCADTEMLIAGGGAVCFSFGTYWNLVGLYILYELTTPACLDWSLLDTSIRPSPILATLPTVNGTEERRSLVQRLRADVILDFPELVKRHRPKIIEGLDFGSCRTRWSRDYLLGKIGRDRPVVVHEAQSRSMNFQRKDFAYVTKPFGSFLEEVYQGGHQYLRSISSSSPSKLVAHLEVDFPEIAQDFQLPPELQLAADTYHSSPLRISGDVAMWLHVDTLANVLCQIEGSKRLILFPPADMVHLGFPPGSTTSSFEIFKGGDPDDILTISGTHPFEAVLRPGEVLFIPPLWAHTAAPLHKLSIAVNVFFRNLATGYAAGKDVYGNRDLQAYEQGRRDVDKIARAFRDMAPDLAHAYLLRLADELKSKADSCTPFSDSG